MRKRSNKHKVLHVSPWRSDNVTNHLSKQHMTKMDDKSRLPNGSANPNNLGKICPKPLVFLAYAATKIRIISKHTCNYLVDVENIQQFIGNCYLIAMSKVVTMILQVPKISMKRCKCQSVFEIDFDFDVCVRLVFGQTSRFYLSVIETGWAPQQLRCCKALSSRLCDHFAVSSGNPKRMFGHVRLQLIRQQCRDCIPRSLDAMPIERTTCKTYTFLPYQCKRGIQGNTNTTCFVPEFMYLGVD
jgi:hypothetical protein